MVNDQKIRHMGRRQAGRLFEAGARRRRIGVGDVLS